jgi:hypothetical protein
LLEAFVQLTTQLVIPVLDHRVQHRSRAVEQTHEDAVLDCARQPPRRLLTETVVELVAVLVQVLVEPLQRGIDHLRVAAVLGDEVQHASRERCERRRFDARAHDVVDRRVHVFVTNQIGDRDCTVEHMSSEPVGVGGLPYPVSGSLHHTSTTKPLDHDLARQERLLDEFAERLTELLLALDDDRGVGNRDAEWMAEQGSDGEPVRQPADHRRFRRGLHVSGQRVVTAPRRDDEEHHGDAREHRRRPSLHDRQLFALELLRAHRRQGPGSGHAVVVPTGTVVIGVSEVADLRPEGVPVDELIAAHPDARAVFFVVDPVW